MSPTPRASMPSKRSSGYSTDLLPNVPDFHHRQLHGDAQRPKFDLTLSPSSSTNPCLTAWWS
ncbi:hypothetical protein BC936DRAFT_144863 [Jimgerdemannia flammicorona]|uniref:Uncharacterized protein n=1 Tax=Jimgerdemannia flammicorona TaxID=994334 RepID=A0A433DBG0_9FUNG|nr:hypothetical protein BC936DRAFT_144863 [Jimgerdemannia flammicorona]